MGSNRNKFNFLKKNGYDDVYDAIMEAISYYQDGHYDHCCMEFRPVLSAILDEIDTAVH